MMPGEALLQKAPIERVEEFWDRRPCNIRHSLRDVGTREYFDEVENRKYFVEPHIPRFAEFERWRGKKVLEIGCGIGTDTVNFARHGASVTAVELSRRSLEVAQQRVRLYGLEHQVRFYHGNAEEMSRIVPVERFDLVYSFGVIHHTPNPEGIIEQIRRYVSSGSTVKFMVYNRHSLKVLWIILKYGRGHFWRASELVARYSEAQEGCPVTFTYTRHEMQDLLTFHGFTVTDMRVDHIFPYRIPDYVQYRYKKVRYFRLTPSGLFRWLERHFGWHLCVTAVVP